MERWIALYRMGSSAGSIASLVLANLIPLAGVLFWGWDLWTILALYWAENGIIGAYNVAKILLAQGEHQVRMLRPDGTIGVASTPGDRAAAAMLGRTSTAIFFLVHYGMFWFVHGIFVLFALPAFTGFGTGEVAFGMRARLDLVIFGAIGLVISHGISFWLDYVGRKAYLAVSPQQQMWAPYARLVVLHMTIILGAFVSAFLGAPIGALVVLVVLKTGLDLGLHLREHRHDGSPGSVIVS